MAQTEQDRVFPRFAADALRIALTDSPVVLVHGPRQCGKTTLVRTVGSADGYGYVTFDDEAARAAAHADPIGFVAALPPRVVLDEVQHAPGIFAAIKLVVDRDRQSGRFLLTGSTNILLLPRLADSLAGRMAIQRLFPLSQAELAGDRPEFLDRAFAGELPTGRGRRLGAELPALLAAGAYPAALQRPVPARRTAWYRDYVETIVQRDVRALGRIAALDSVPRLLELAAGQTARLLNISELAGPFQVSRPTIRDYLTLLQRVFLVEELRPWHDNRLSRLVKTPKLHIGDTGLACALLGADAADLANDRQLLGQLLESFVFHELRAQASWRDEDCRLAHFRDKDGGEVDFVVEQGRKVVGIEVKAGATVTGSDFNGLRKLAAATGARFAAGIVLHDGEAGLPFGDRMWAMPLRVLWQGGTRRAAGVAREPRLRWRLDWPAPASRLRPRRGGRTRTS